MKGLDFQLGADAGGELAIFLQLLAVVDGVELHRLLARLVIEALVMGVEAGRHHVGMLLLEQAQELRLRLGLDPDAGARCSCHARVGSM